MKKTVINILLSNTFSKFSDLQFNVPHAHPQRTEAIHMSHMSKRILPQFRPQETCEEITRGRSSEKYDNTE